MRVDGIPVFVVRYCLFCEKEYKTNPSRLIHRRGLFCSKSCSYGWRGKNKVKLDKKWTEEFKKDYSKRYRLENKESISALNKLWKNANRHTVILSNKMERDRLKKEVFQHYSSVKMACANCGFGDIRALDLDHINGDGAKKRRKLFGSRLCAGTTYYRHLRKNGFPEGYQVLCRNCNWIKKIHDDNKIAI